MILLLRVMSIYNCFEYMEKYQFLLLNLFLFKSEMSQFIKLEIRYFCTLKILKVFL